MVINDMALPKDYLPDELEYPTCVYALHELAHKSEEVELRKRADRRDAKAKSLEPEVEKLHKQIEQLDEEEKRIRNQTLEP